MIRLTSKVFNDLAIWMIGLGLITGIVFPFFVVLMGVPADLALTAWFFAACMIAGFMVGGLNILLARITVGRNLRKLASHMRLVEKNLREIARSGDMEKCTPETCSIEVDSEDEIGDSSRAFNNLVEALAASIQSDDAVKQFNQMLASYLELDILADKALSRLLKYSEAAAGAILISAEGKTEIAASRGIRTPEILLNSDNVKTALLSGIRVIKTVPADVVVEGVLTDFRPREILLDPLVYKGVPLGVIILASGENFTGRVKILLNKFLPSMALAFNNALTHDRLQRLAAFDPLTITYNRRFGMARLREEFSRTVRTTGPLGLILFDIDHFKKVNDTYGHVAGDRVLMQVAKVARAAIREGDIIMRYGGEEFVVILPAASKDNSCEVGERLRRMVEETSFKEGDQEIHITISLGITSYPELQVEKAQDLLKHADEALYKAKESGRNQISCI